ncbi:hypothetical protein G5C51_17935 [Streptomyces sp. A7024]|uniref:Uncharacterized protein n=1 Tax=Streptomyces coryli TaxID=1128680 RepID=A0A6G4U199_9ACTN|nr:hypothetical protein [Streptomyces coryli]NGN65772.1 hypothetical protein [Streptomyces coryli]
MSALPGLVPDPAAVDPAVLGALLARHGWRSRGGAAARGYARWTPPAEGPGGISLLVPADRAYPDCDDLLAEALTALGRSAVPSATDILVALAAPADEVRWERDTPAGAGWPGEELLRAGGRAMLLAAALGARERAGYHGARHRVWAADEVARVVLGPGGGNGCGGARLTAFVPAPEGRAAVAVLVRSLHAVRDAADYARATGGMEAFDAAVELGACAELTGAVVGLVRGTEGARVSVAWAPAVGVPEGFAERPEPVEFTPGDLDVLRRAGQRYKRDEPSYPVRVTGVVVRLRRRSAAGDGDVRLRVIAGAEVAQVRCVLGEDAYRIAGHAHLVGMPVRVSGRLESRGGFRRVTGVSEVVPVEVDEAERDRALKSLHENLDFFEEACGS